MKVNVYYIIYSGLKTTLCMSGKILEAVICKWELG